MENTFINRVRQVAGQIEGQAASAPTGARFEQVVTGETETATVTTVAVFGWPTVTVRFSDGTTMTTGGPVTDE